MASMNRLCFVAPAVLLLCCRTHPAVGSRAPAEVADELLEADRSHAAAAAVAGVSDAIANLLAPDAWMPAAGTMYRGRDAALAYLRSSPDFLAGRLEWAPVRVGVSADGTHGFTFGFMTQVRTDSTRVPLKYLAYWVRGSEGWKAVAYKRVQRGPGPVPDSMRAPSLPARLVAPDADAARAGRFAMELGDAERAFSVLAGEIGLGPAFQRNAAEDAMNMGGPGSADFAYGPASIAAAVGAGQDGPSKLTWGPDRVIVASSGDLGVSIGHINVPGDAGAPPRRVPFFTVWRRDGPGGTWRFVAE